MPIHETENTTPVFESQSETKKAYGHLEIADDETVC